MSSSQFHRARLLIGAFSATGLFTIVLPTPSFAQARWHFDGLHMVLSTPIHGLEQTRLAPPPIHDVDVNPVRQVSTAPNAGATGRQMAPPAIDNFLLAQDEPEEEGAGEPSLLPPEEMLDDPGLEQILPEEAPSGAIQDIAPEQQVPIAEVIIVGLSGHPEKERLEIVAYDAMEVRPGATTTRSQLERDLTAIYATGWFSDVRVVPTDGPLGVSLEVTVTPNPVLSAVELEDQDALLPEEVLQEAFATDKGQTINLVSLQRRLARLMEWYAEQGYSLARVLGPTRITPEGVVVLTVREGRVSAIEIEFANDDGETTDEDGKPIRSNTKRWVITRELSTQAGDRFNRRVLQQDLERLYGTGLFSDINVSLQPIPSDPGLVDLVLKIQEAKTGSLSGGLGYSDAQGIYGEISFSEDNLFGRAWRTTSQIIYGQRGTALDLSFYDPWIKDDPYRTGFRMNVFLTEEIPLQFQREEGQDMRLLEYYHKAPNPDEAENPKEYDENNRHEDRVFSAKDKNNPGQDENNELGGRNLNPETDNLYYKSDNHAVRLQRQGMNFQFIRPLNQGNPHAEDTKWTASAGLTFQQVTIQTGDDDARVYAKGPDKVKETTDNFFCVGHDCQSQNILAGLRLGILYNTLDNKTNPTSGNFASFSTEQYISVGEGSPTFNRAQFNLTHFIPVKLLKIHRGCRPGPGEAEECPQTLALQVAGGTLLGTTPSYESFCLGGSTSIRGFYECAIGPGTTFGEVSAEYRFPIIGIVSGTLFADAGTVLGSQENVTGNPGLLLEKPDSGFSYGAGVVLSTPLGPLRGEMAKANHNDNWRFNFGVGWKF